MHVVRIMMCRRSVYFLNIYIIRVYYRLNRNRALQVPTQKATWVPMKENPSGIGFSVAFGTTDKIVLELITVEEGTETILESQQIVPVQQSSETEPLKDTLQLDNQNLEEEMLDHIDATPAANQGADRTDTPEGNPSLVVTHTFHSPIFQNHNVSMQLENVSDDIVNLDGNTISVLSPVKNKTLDISSIVAPKGSKIDSVLQKDLDFMHTWLSKAAATEVPFTEVVSKSQEKKKRICKKFHIKPALRVLFHRLNEYHFLEHPRNW